jgi:hypothetical protein
MIFKGVLGEKINMVIIRDTLPNNSSNPVPKYAPIKELPNF